MIQAISSSNVQPSRGAQPLRQSFKQDSQTGIYFNAPPKRKSSLGDKAAWTAEQFTKGAVVGVLFTAIGDVMNLVTKRAGASPFSEYAAQAGICGAVFVAAALVFRAFDARRANKNG